MQKLRCQSLSRRRVRLPWAWGFLSWGDTNGSR